MSLGGVHMWVMRVMLGLTRVISEVSPPSHPPPVLPVQLPAPPLVLRLVAVCSAEFVQA